MKHLLEVYPYEIHISAPSEITAEDYMERVEEAIQWLTAGQNLIADKDFKIGRMSGKLGISMSFKKQRPALLFKMAFG